MNDEEKAAWEKQQEKERKRNDGDAKKRAREDAKVRSVPRSRLPFNHLTY